MEPADRFRAAGSAFRTGAAVARDATGRQTRGPAQDTGSGPGEGRRPGGRRRSAVRRRAGPGRAHGRLCRSTATPSLPEFRRQHPGVAADRRIVGVPDPVTGAGHGAERQGDARPRSGRCGASGTVRAPTPAPGTAQSALPAGGRSPGSSPRDPDSGAPHCQAITPPARPSPHRPGHHPTGGRRRPPRTATDGLGRGRRRPECDITRGPSVGRPPGGVTACTAAGWAAPGVRRSTR